jgi:cardiolipin synthase
MPGEMAGLTLPIQALQRWQTTAARLLALGGGSDGNEVVLFVDGDDAFAAKLAAIESAQQRVWLETYIFRPDGLGRRVLSALTTAAQRGLDVRLLVDDHGSGALSENDVEALVRAGGRVARFNPTPVWRLGRGLVRDHRKILIVDADHGFVGGMNVADDYGGARLGTGLFRDTHLLLSGPATKDLAEVFSRSWQQATGELVSVSIASSPRPDGSHVQILGSDRFLRRRRIQRALATAVQRAQRSITLTTPYFIPPPRLLRSLRQAARRGVQVRILTAGVSDVPIAAVAARHVYGSLLEAGVRIWELQRQTLHAKTVVVDGFYAHVGSFNLDRWSYDRNHEVVAMTLDPGIGAALEKVFADDLAHSTEVHLEQWRRRTLWQRLMGFLAWQIAKL